MSSCTGCTNSIQSPEKPTLTSNVLARLLLHVVHRQPAHRIDVLRTGNEGQKGNRGRNTQSHISGSNVEGANLTDAGTGV
jgi:hypothetical protein